MSKVTGFWRHARWLCVVLCVGVAACASAEPGPKTVDYNNMPGYNYDEAKIPPYELLDPQRMADGKPVTTQQQWWTQRRPEIVKLFEDNIYGRTPAAADQAPVRVESVEGRAPALDGLAYREQVDLIFGPTPKPGSHTAWRMRVLLYLPARATGPVPVIFGLNGGGNQSVVDDPGIKPTDVWVSEDEQAPHPETPGADTRGSQSTQWQVKTVLSRGYGLATAYYQDLEPDAKDQRVNSVRALFEKPGTSPAPNEWGAVAAWAWGYRKAVAYLRSNPAVDAAHVAVTGHSRLGKAADWAAATTPEIGALLSTESGKGGQSIQRRELGETVEHLAEKFPHWMCPAYATWIDRDQQIPADGNLLLSLVAPRPLYTASANDDRWADPKGEFLSLRSAATTYTLLGTSALPSDTPMPPVDQPIGTDTNTAYHIRSGKHDVTAYDWQRYLDFLDTRWGAPAHR
ncbi:glucuronyl esterase domain-containing protein [Nocardia pneumoniae]|uniref:glucuronyl esterase domain-containing protein n=1 Tax=Nocardia pneumoniae TaxID=228601 RepID=UPI0012F6E31C|nr:acetylxylan esterase [Nocardia pneumoniae]